MRENHVRVLGVDPVDSDKIIVDFSDDMHVTFALAELLAITPSHAPSNVNDENVVGQVRWAS